MVGCSSSIGISNVVNLRNEVVLRKMWSQNLFFDGVRFRNDAKEVALPVFRRNNRFRQFLFGEERLEFYGHEYVSASG